MFGKTKVALISLKSSDVSARQINQMQKSLMEALQKEELFELVSQKDVAQSLSDDFIKILKKEIKKAWEDCYQFHFEEGLELLKGREDEEALKLQALLSLEKGKSKGMSEEVAARNFLIRLLTLHAPQDPPSDIFPPKFIHLYQEVRQKTSLTRAQRRAGVVLAPGIFMAPSSLKEWRGRFASLAREELWDRILVAQLSPVGWNVQMTLYVFSSSPMSFSGPKMFVGEMVDGKEIDSAAKILIKKAFVIDTPSEAKLISN